MDELASSSLTDEEITDRLTRLDALLERLETLPQPGQAIAVEAVELLTEVYGSALAHIVEACDDAMVRRFAGDELVGHLLVLHGLHPESTEERIAHAVDDLRPLLAGKGDVSFT